MHLRCGGSTAGEETNDYYLIMNRSIGILAFYVLLATGCSKHSEKDDDSNWAEMASFHQIMAKVYHPFKDSADLRPVKGQAEQLAQEADRWAASAIPSDLNKDELKLQLEELRSATRSLADEITAGATDQKIAADLAAVHDKFHSIMEASHGEKERHEH